MKKNILIPLMICAAFCLCGCNGKQATPKANGMPKADTTMQSESLRIAYVNVDSLMTQLDMCIEAKARLEAKSQTYSNNVASKERAFQQAYADFAKKMQSSGYPSQAEYEAAQQRLQQMQTEGANLQEKYAIELQKEQDAFNLSLHDSLQNYIKILNKDGQYSMILAKSGDNILYADPAFDITKEVVAGMNKRWKKMK